MPIPNTETFLTDFVRGLEGLFIIREQFGLTKLPVLADPEVFDMLAYTLPYQLSEGQVKVYLHTGGGYAFVYPNSPYYSEHALRGNLGT